MWLTSPPAPMQRTLLAEKIAWLKPGILFWRSSAPGMRLPLSLIEICETVDVLSKVFDSCAMDFNLEVFIQPQEAHVAVTAEDRRHRGIASVLQPSLEA